MTVVKKIKLNPAGAPIETPAGAAFGVAFRRGKAYRIGIGAEIQEALELQVIMRRRHFFRLVVAMRKVLDVMLVVVVMYLCFFLFRLGAGWLGV